MITPKDILEFWLGLSNEARFRADPGLDEEIRHRFETAHQDARQGQLDHWLQTPDGALAVIILLDQFARNIYRNTPDMFSADDKARALAQAAIDKGHDMALPANQRIWLYLPFQHSEDLVDQEFSVVLTPRTEFADNLQYAKEHHDIIARFGRFPHRNVILGRETTPDEQAFLDGGGFAG